MTRVLVVDDEPSILRALRINLSAREYDVSTAVDGTTGLAAVARDRPDVIILDLGLPDMDGTDVIHGVRGWTSIPIIVLSAWGQESQKVAALDAGADDYVTKPFGMDELLARLRAAVRRAAPAPDEPVVSTPDFTVDLAVKQVIRSDGEDVRLTPTEWQLLEILVRNSGRLVTQRQLLREVWGPSYETETNYLRVYLAQLRRKLEPEPQRDENLVTQLPWPPTAALLPWPPMGRWQRGIPAPYALPVGFAAFLAVGTVAAALHGRLDATGVLIACTVVAGACCSRPSRSPRWRWPASAGSPSWGSPGRPTRSCARPGRPPCTPRS